ncbi:C40 family peptidase [Salinithrix halophila]|uniref:NlpC/P60 family protein n=1 Tax=Salinithrix halophila TaxID=1485204 RepID=A0ABV8JDL2_9BACL
MTIRYACVPVANLWTAPEKVREVDLPSLGNPEGFHDWLGRMDLDRRKGLYGRLESQLLYGEPALVLEEREGWVRVCLPRQFTHKDSRGYPGWVPAAHLGFTAEYHRAQEEGPFIFVTAYRSHLTLKKGETLTVSFMTRLPKMDEKDGEVIVLTPQGEKGRIPVCDITVTHRPPVTAPTARVETARRFLGLAYLWAGMSSFGFDCSGFVHRVFEANGVSIPRDAGDQFRFGQKISSTEELLPGDLVFFAHEAGRGAIHHVGMAIGDNRFIHSPNTGNPVRLNNLADEPYRSEFCGGARYDGTEPLE